MSELLENDKDGGGRLCFVDCRVDICNMPRNFAHCSGKIKTAKLSRKMDERKSNGPHACEYKCKSLQQVQNAKPAWVPCLGWEISSKLMFHRNSPSAISTFSWLLCLLGDSPCPQDCVQSKVGLLLGS